MERNDVADMVDATVRVLTATWGPTHVELLDPIRTGWGRHDLVVCNVDGPPGTPATVVVKAPVANRSALFSEWAVHSWLSDDPRTADLVTAFHGGDGDMPLIVTGDAGGGPSLARLLQVPGAAWPVVASERHTTAVIHAATRGRGAELGARRAALPDGPGPDSVVVDADRMRAVLESWSTPLAPELVAELRSAAARLDADPEFACLTLRDACPVNRLATPTGLVAIDFEHARFGHPGIDAAYPAIGHLGCTTRTRPGEAIAWPMEHRLTAEHTYREAVTGAYPEWRGDRFGVDLAAATLAWMCTILVRVRDRAVPHDRSSPARLVARSRIVSTLEAVAAVADRTDGLAATERWATELTERCREWWPDVDALPLVAGFGPAERRDHDQDGSRSP